MHKPLAFALLSMVALGAAAAPDAGPRTRYMAANCSYCHGPDGHSRGAIPSLAGIEARYFIDQMKAFRDGSRPATVMAAHANGYTDAEIEALGKWFESHK
jgi:cytochrome c553